MTGDIRKLIHATPFVPFTIHLADGGQLRVPTVDHVAIAPQGGRVIAVPIRSDDPDIPAPGAVTELGIAPERCHVIDDL